MNADVRRAEIASGEIPYAPRRACLCEVQPTYNSEPARATSQAGAGWIRRASRSAAPIHSMGCDTMGRSRRLL